MDIIILAETTPKDSYNEVGLQFYKQYAIGHNLTDSEKDHFYKFYRLQDVYSHVNPVITMRRRVDNRGGNLSFWQWDYFDICQDQTRASLSFGDSDYYFHSASVHPLHVQAIAKVNRQEELRKELDKLEERITPHTISVYTLKEEYNDKYTVELKSKRLYSKAREGNAPQNVITEIQDRIRAEYTAELNKITARIQEIKTELESI